jgi:hypothetical protein
MDRNPKITGRVNILLVTLGLGIKFNFTEEISVENTCFQLKTYFGISSFSIKYPLKNLLLSRSKNNFKVKENKVLIN